MTSSSLTLSLSFFSLFLGVATPAALVGLCDWLVAALGCGGVLSRSLGGSFKGKSVVDEAGDFCGSFPGTGLCPFCGPEGRGSLVVFDLPICWLWVGDLDGRRCDVDRSREGETVCGGVGAGL